MFAGFGRYKPGLGLRSRTGESLNGYLIFKLSEPELLFCPNAAVEIISKQKQALNRKKAGKLFNAKQNLCNYKLFKAIFINCSTDKLSEDVFIVCSRIFSATFLAKPNITSADKASSLAV